MTTKNYLNRPREYNTWNLMKQRCDNPKDARYLRYHGLGYDPRWKLFSNFIEDMGDRPEGYSLDRIDNTKGYSKNNCRWATKLQQANNKINSHFIFIDGIKKTVAEWTRCFGQKGSTVRMRLKYGWDEITALSYRSVERSQNNYR